MSTDDMKGRAKEAAGDLTGNKNLQNEGKTDRASGKAKGVVDKVKNKISGLVNPKR